jgi:hypothetical protein
LFAVGNLGTPRSWGYGGVSPHLPDPNLKIWRLRSGHDTFFRKSFGRELKISENIRLSCWVFLKKVGSIPENFGKWLTPLLRISKKERIKFWEFRKKAGPVAEYFQKRLDQFLRIPEKGRLSC